MTDRQTIVDTPAKALRYVRRAYPALDAREGCGLGDSWFSSAYLLVDTWLFRFPRIDAAEHAYRKERLFLSRLAPLLDIATPRLDCVAELPDGRTFMGHLAIPGEAVTRTAVASMDAAGRDVVAQQIASFLRTVHAFPVDVAREVGLEEDELRDEYAKHHEMARRQLSADLTAGECVALDASFHGFLDDPSNFTYAPVPRHADLWGRHVLLDTQRRVAGIIDYGCACLGDPDYDFFPLLADVGEEFGRAILLHYGHTDPDRAIRKGRFFAAFDGIETWVTGADEDCDWKVADGRKQLTRALAAYAESTST
jgi:aminoglycoside 2''-phosphotransferase